MKFLKYRKSFFTVIAALSLCCPSHGQQALKKLTPDQYGRWGHLRLQQASDDGNWIIFTTNHGASRDTLHIHGSRGSIIYTIAGGRPGKFVTNGSYAFTTADGLHLLSLQSGDKKNIGNVDRYEVTPDKGALIYSASDAGAKYMGIYYAGNGASRTFKADEYLYNPASNTVAAVVAENGGYALFSVDVPDGSKVVLHRGTGYLAQSMAWDSKGKSIAFAEHHATRGDRLLSYVVSKRQLSSLYPGQSGLIAGEVSLIPQKLAYASDGKSITFYIRPQAVSKNTGTEGPEIWNTLDKEMFPEKEMNKGWQDLPKLALWTPADGTAKMLTDKESPYIMLTAANDYALAWDPSDNPPDHSETLGLQYTLRNLRSNSAVPFPGAPDARPSNVATSPNGTHITFFNGRDWMAYKLSTGAFFNLTAALPVRFCTEKDGRLTTVPFSSPGWDGHGRFILYDNYDIWAVKPGKVATRLTAGREKGIRYRIAPHQSEIQNRSNHHGARELLVDTAAPLLLEMSKGRAGYAVLWPDGELSEICGGSGFFSQGILVANGSALVCMHQDHDRPAHLIFYDKGRGQSVVFELDRHYSEYGVQKMMKLDYRTAAGKNVSGVLYYPLIFDATQKHPVIVHIYEDQGWQASRYVKPSLGNPAGFNITNFTGDGYFVFLPDIVYDGGNPGDDALDCVEAGVKEITGLEYINAGKIGLIGHSFGGYQTNYVIGHSKSFAAAVSGAPINDLSSFYHYIVRGVFKPNFSNVENGQFRIPFPYFEQPARYLEASPLFSANSITTPLLSWGGKEDMQIDQSQIISLYLALRRMGKKHVMLLYPGEGHTLSSSENQGDLTLKISQWFAHFLKDSQVPAWAHPDN